jgi:hypothetical protein
MAAVGDPIAFSDYDAIQSVTQQLLGTVTAQTGYGQTDFLSAPYPFIRNVTAVTKGATPTVTAANHGLVAGEVVYFYDITTGMTQLNDTYATVVSRISSSQFTININTTSYSTWSGTGKIAQYIVSANQFSALRTDLRRIREHQEGTAPTLTTPTRGTLIQFSSYSPFFNTLTTANARKFWAAGTTEHEPDQSPNNYTPDWNDQRVARLEVTWPTVTDARQFFNCGGYLEFETNITSGTTDTDRISRKNLNWKTLLDNTPVRFGARNRANMANRSGNWTSLGFYNLTSSQASVYIVTSSGAYSSNYFQIYARLLSTNRVRFDFEWVDGHVNQFAENVTGTLQLRFKFVYPIDPISLAVTPNEYGISYTTIRGSI